MDSLKDLLTSIKRSTLDRTDLDEKLVSGVKNFSRNKTVQGIGKAAFNTAAPSLNLVGQIGQTPQYQSAFKASANQLRNQVTQGIPAMYRLTDFANPQKPFTFSGINGVGSSQRILQNPRQFASDITKAGSLAATAYGAPKVTPQLMGVSGLLGGAFNRFGGGSFSEGFGKGVAVSPQIAGITRLTNPVINSTASRFSSQFNNPLTRSLTGRGATGALNVPEGMAIDASLGQPTTLGSMGIDFASGFATGRTGTGGKVRLRPSKGLGMAKNQYEYMKPEHKDDVGKLIENLIFKGEDLNYNIQNKSKIEDQLRMYAEMYINKDFAWGTRKAGKGRNAQQIYKTSLQDVAQELMNRIRSENEAPDLFLPQLPFAAKNQTKVATAGLSDTGIVDLPVYRAGRGIDTAFKKSDLGKVAYYGDNPNIAKMYGGNVHEARATIRKPFVISEKAKSLGGKGEDQVKIVREMGGTQKFREYLKKNGYDGIVIEKDYGREILPFDKSQLRTTSQGLPMPSEISKRGSSGQTMFESTNPSKGIISNQRNSSRVAQPSIDDTELPEGALGFANISSEGTKMKSGKIKVRNFPTQTEVKNRAELNAGNPDLYTQRGQKIKTILGQEGMGGNVQTVQSRQRKSDILPNFSDTISSPVSPRGQTSGKIPYRSSNGKIPSNTDPVNVTGIDKPSRFTKFREVVQDEWVRVKNLQRQKGVKVDETSNPYLMEELYHGRVGARLEDVKSTVSTIDKDIVKTAKNLKTEDAKLTQMVNEYLHAKHTPERNARLGDGAAGMTNAEAQKILKDIDASPLGKEVKRIAAQVKELNNKTLDILYDGEVIDKELYDTLRATYKDHVPLNRIMDETGEIADILAGKGFNVKGTGVKRAKGSDREVADIFTNVTANVEQAIVRAERNRVNKATLNFARQNPQLGIFEEIRPKAIGESFDGKPLLKQITDPNVLHVRENGKPVYLKIKDDRLAQVFQGVGQEKLPSLFNFVSTFTRFYSGLHTRFNPEFAVSNIVRDTQELAVYMASQKNVGLRGSVKTVTKDPKSIKAITDFLRGVDSPDARLYKQMQMDGGTTGGMALSTREKVELDIEQIRRLNRSNPKQAMEKLLQGFDKWNTIFEDSSRLSAYKQALESGYSRDQAASIAKNSTVNFNKKGSGGAIINSLYMFSNASIQGSTKMLRAMKDPKVAGAVLTTVGGSTFAVNSWNDSVDPDWRDKVTEWDRTSNLVVMIPSTEGAKYFTIPVSWGIKPIKVAADTAYDLATGKTNNVGDAAFKILKSGIDAYNPTGGTDAISMLSPTVMDLPVDLARNKSWTGAKIKPDWMEGLPQAEQRFSNTDQTLTGKIATQATKALSEKTNRVLDFNPEQLLYAYDNLIGGVGRFGSKTLNLVTSISQGSLPPAKDVPFGSRFYKTRTEEQIQQGLGYKSENEFFDKLKQFETGSEMQKEEIRNYLRTLPDDDARKNTLFKIRDQGFDTKGISYSAEKLGPSTISDTTPTERVFEESPEAPQNVMERVRMAAQGMTKDPGNVIKAIFTEERMRKIENDAVILERELYLNNLNDKNLHVDHVIPLGLGGDNSDGNLQVMTVDEKAKKDKLEKQLIYQLQTGQIDRVSAQAQIRAFNMENPVGVPYDRMSKTKQKALEDKVVEITDVEDENGYPTMPKLTGNKELDKKLMSKFRGEITKKKNEIVKAYEAGEMTAEEAEAELMKLNSIESSSKAKSGKGSKKAPPVFKLVSSQTQLSAPFSGGGSNFTVKTPSMTSSSIGSTKVPRLRLTPSKSSENARKLRLAIQNSNLSAPRLTFTRK